MSKSLQFCLWFQSSDTHLDHHETPVELEQALNLLGETYIDTSKNYRGFENVGAQKANQPGLQTNNQSEAV